MDLAPRERLLDIDWLVDMRVREGLDALKQCVRAGADAYGGAVTAIADIVLARPVAHADLARVGRRPAAQALARVCLLFRRFEVRHGASGTARFSCAASRTSRT